MRGFGSTRGNRGLGTRPRLSVVVPVYNVEPFVAECLDSLLSQSFTDFEAIVVLDGPTDGSSAVVGRYAREDRRIRVLRQANAGLGAARNAGVRAARGEYLTFLDSDDRLLPSSYSTMMATIERSGSDMVVGTLKRELGRRQSTMRLMQVNHRVRRERMTLADMPLMLADVFPVNKIFRRTFWDHSGLTFPEGLRYEDQPTLTKAFLAATRFDVIPDTVYLWRVRADRSSITQRRHELADLADRVESKRISTRLVLGTDVPNLRATWFHDILPVDMWEYFRAAASGSDEYWELLRSAVHELWSSHGVRFEETGVPVQQRRMGWLVEHGRRGDLRRLIEFIDAHHGDIPVEVRGDRVVACLPALADPSVTPPESVSVLAEHELNWEGRLLESSWEDGMLHVEGFALVRNAPTDGVPTALSGRLQPLGGTAAPRQIDLWDVPDHRATKFVGRPSQGYDDCGFRASIDVAGLWAAARRAGDWRISLRRQVDRIHGAGGLTVTDPTRIDGAWHPLGAANGSRARARLALRDGELVVELRTAAVGVF